MWIPERSGDLPADAPQTPAPARFPALSAQGSHVAVTGPPTQPQEMGEGSVLRWRD